MTQYYDSRCDRLVYLKQEAGADYWDNHWDDKEFEKLVKVKGNHFITGNTSKFIKAGGRILEGGCGRGDKVYALRNSGYEAYGIDFAEETVRKVNCVAPELNVSLGDVRSIDFDDEYFDGYWSLGVIEHFYDGYSEIMDEMHRVLKKGGVLFMTVPSMSLLRRLKARLGFYPIYEANKSSRERFYQFALPPSTIISDFEEKGFSLISHRPYDGIKGLKDEVLFLRPALQYFYEDKTLLGKVSRFLINSIVQRFSNHMSFYVFHKR